MYTKEEAKKQKKTNAAFTLVSSKSLSTRKSNPPSLVLTKNLKSLRNEFIFEYDTTKFPFEKLAKEIFQASDLSQIHTCPIPTCGDQGEDWQDLPLCPTLCTAWILRGDAKAKKLPKLGRAKREKYFERFWKSEIAQKFLHLFEDFVQTVILPHVGDPLGVVCQIPPTLRCHLPSDRPLTKIHRDGDYRFHQSSEINFWVPLTHVAQSNSLYLESKPGKKDFHSVTMSYKQVLRFWGYAVSHYTVPNKTKKTRISFDFRVIPRSLYNPNADGFRRGFIGDYRSKLFY